MHKKNALQYIHISYAMKISFFTYSHLQTLKNLKNLIVQHLRPQHNNGIC